MKDIDFVCVFSQEDLCFKGYDISMRENEKCSLVFDIRSSHLMSVKVKKMTK